MPTDLVCRKGARTFLFRCALSLFLGLTLVACSSIRGAPQRPFAATTVVKSLEATEKDIETVLGPTTTAAIRNGFIQKMLALVDIRFQEFVQKLNVQKSGFDAAASILGTGLSVAGTLVGSANAKTNLAAGTAFLSGGRETIDKTYFYERTVPALVTAMQAGRSEIRVQIMTGMNQPMDVYPAATAIRDLLIYSDAGTLLGALQYVQTKSGASEQNSQQEIRKIEILTPEEIDLKTQLTTALRASNPNSSDTAKLRLLISDSGGTPVGTTAPELLQELQRMIREATPEKLTQLDRVFQTRSFYPPAQPANPQPPAEN